MIRNAWATLLGLTLLLMSYHGSFGWGVWGHEHINRAAVFALPVPLRGFFFNHIDFISVEASIPDIRKYTIHDTKEGPRHYIDLEAYGAHPFQALPETWDSAKARYGEAKLVKNGILPWYILEIQDKLTTAFRRQDKTTILFLAADLAHYIGDANMPLHTALNHDGQFTGQRGVHALWESYLPELFGNRFNLRVKAATYIADPLQKTWDILKESHALEGPLLESEKKLLDSWPKQKIYVVDSAGRIEKNKYGNARFSPAFARAYYEALNGMVERQMRLAIQQSADFWYTAWVNAGKPDLSQLDDTYTWKINRGPMHDQYDLWVKKGKLVGLKPVAEF